MKTRLLFLLGIIVLIVTNSLQAQGTAFTYQGQLANNGLPANGSFDLTFSLFDASNGVGQVGTTLTNSAVAVSNGLFNVALDFGNQFPGADRWLEIGVRTNSGGTFTTLSPRQQLTPNPYAITASSASNLLGTLSVSQLSGALALSQIPSAVVTNNASSVSLTGTFSGDGSGLVNTVTTANYVSAYDTANHTVSTPNTFQSITFDAISVSGWTYFGGSSGTFTCNQSGTYLVQYDAEVETTTSNATTISLRAFNENIDIEIPGSESSCTLAVATQPAEISKSFLTYVAAGNLLQFQFTGSSTSAELIGGTGAATYQPSISCTIIRIQ